MRRILLAMVIGLLSRNLGAQDLRDSSSARIMDVPVDIENNKDRCVVSIGGLKPLIEDLRVPPDCFFAKDPVDHNKVMLAKQGEDIQSLIVISIDRKMESKKKAKASCFVRLQCILATRDASGVFVRPTVLTLEDLYKVCPSKQQDVLSLNDLWKLCHSERDPESLLSEKKSRLSSLRKREDWSLNYDEEIKRLSSDTESSEKGMKINVIKK